ncbi:MAG: glycosyltransferase [Deltaproteobacteria bacterium]|nr:glycosyltransferase [Deltaproteobacteria bacterium]
MKSINPKTSVIMPTYNVEDYISQSVSSILNQTFSDFEFIIIDDGSKDKTPRIIRSFKDPRIRFYQRPHLGTVYQLNFGLKQARGQYIARQDGDDYSNPKRFQKQVHFLDTHPEYGVVSSAMQLIDEKKCPIGTLRYPEEPDFAKLMEKCYISHPASMWRREINQRIGGYDEQFNKNCCEDYDFWLRVVEYYRLYVLDEILYIKREHPGSSISQTRWTYVPLYDELTRAKARMRMSRRGMKV